MLLPAGYIWAQIGHAERNRKKEVKDRGACVLKQVRPHGDDIITTLAFKSPGAQKAAASGRANHLMCPATSHTLDENWWHGIARAAYRDRSAGWRWWGLDAPTARPLYCVITREDTRSDGDWRRQQPGWVKTRTLRTARASSQLERPGGLLCDHTRQSRCVSLYISVCIRLWGGSQRADQMWSSPDVFLWQSQRTAVFFFSIIILISSRVSCCSLCHSVWLVWESYQGSVSPGVLRIPLHIHVPVVPVFRLVFHSYRCFCSGRPATQTLLARGSWSRFALAVFGVDCADLLMDDRETAASRRGRFTPAVIAPGGLEWFNVAASIRVIDDFGPHHRRAYSTVTL